MSEDTIVLIFLCAFVAFIILLVAMVIFIKYAARKPARLALQDECGKSSIP